MNIKYFFLTDRIRSGEMTVRYCPTSEMIADHLTKPLQGHLFRKFRSVIMNIDEDIPDADLAWESVSPASHATRPQECVGYHGQCTASAQNARASTEKTPRT